MRCTSVRVSSVLFLHNNENLYASWRLMISVFSCDFSLTPVVDDVRKANT